MEQIPLRRTWGLRADNLDALNDVDINNSAVAVAKTHQRRLDCMLKTTMRSSVGRNSAFCTLISCLALVGGWVCQMSWNATEKPSNNLHLTLHPFKRNEDKLNRWADHIVDSNENVGGSFSNFSTRVAEQGQIKPLLASLSGWRLLFELVSALRSGRQSWPFRG